MSAPAFRRFHCSGHLIRLSSVRAMTVRVVSAPPSSRCVANECLTRWGVSGVWITADQAWEGIVKQAKRKKADLIVMASHSRRGLSGLLLGSETTKVLTHSKFPVLVCR